MSRCYISMAMIILMITALFACKDRAPLDSNVSAVSKADSTTITDVLTDIVTRRQAVIAYLKKFGIVKVREQNMTQEGKLSGSVEGSVNGGGAMLRLGNAGALLQSVLGATTDLFPFPTAASFMNSLNGGWGGGLMNVSGTIEGQISGSFNGSGHVVHNAASLFYISVRADKFFSTAAVKSWDKPELKEGFITELRKVSKSKFISSESEYNIFTANLAGIQTSIDALELMMAKYAADVEATGVMQNIRSIISDTKKALATKRIVVTMIGANLNQKTPYEKLIYRNYRVHLERADYYTKKGNPQLAVMYHGYPLGCAGLSTVFPTLYEVIPSKQFDVSQKTLAIQEDVEAALGLKIQEYYSKTLNCSEASKIDEGFAEKIYAWIGLFASEKRLSFPELVAKGIFRIEPLDIIRVDTRAREGDSISDAEFTQIIPEDQSGTYLLIQ